MLIFSFSYSFSHNIFWSFPSPNSSQVLPTSLSIHLYVLSLSLSQSLSHFSLFNNNKQATTNQTKPKQTQRIRKRDQNETTKPTDTSGRLQRKDSILDMEFEVSCYNDNRKLSLTIEKCVGRGTLSGVGYFTRRNWFSFDSKHKW